MGFYEASSVVLIAIGLPLVLIGSWLGDRVIRRLDPRMFGRLVGGLILLSGVALLVLNSAKAALCPIRSVCRRHR